MSLLTKELFISADTGHRSCLNRAAVFVSALYNWTQPQISYFTAWIISFLCDYLKENT